jgi:hypothetical protein
MTNPFNIFPSNNRLTGYGYGLSKACIRLRPMSYGTNTVKGFCIRLTNIENTVWLSDETDEA